MALDPSLVVTGDGQHTTGAGAIVIDRFVRPGTDLGDFNVPCLDVNTVSNASRFAPLTRGLCLGQQRGGVEEAACLHLQRVRVCRPDFARGRRGPVSPSRFCEK